MADNYVIGPFKEGKEYLANNLLIGKANKFIQTNNIITNPRSIGDVINNVAVRITRRVVEQVDIQRFSDTYLLRESIRMPIVLFGETFTASLMMVDYYDRLNKGVSGFIIDRPDTPYKFGLNTEFPSVFELEGWADRRDLDVFAVRKSMFRKGTRGNQFFDVAMDDVENGEINRLFLKELKEVGSEQIINGLNEVFVTSGAKIK